MVKNVRRLLPVVFLAGLALWSTSTAWNEPVNWSSDALFYQAHTLMLRGESEQTALRTTLTGEPGRQVRLTAAGNLHELAQLRDPRWIAYNEQITRRRVLVPALAAAVYPLFGLWSLQAVSLAGYLAFGLLLYALLRRRFQPGASTIVVSVCLLLPAMRLWSQHPLTDSWGVALETACLLAGLLVLDRGVRWLPLWVVAIAALSLTRDATVVVVAGAAWVAVRERTPRSILLTLTGAAAALPAPLAFGNPLGNAVGNAVGNFQSGYWPSLQTMLRQDLYVNTIGSQQRLTGLVLLGGIALLLVRPQTEAVASARRLASIACLAYVVFNLLSMAFFFSGLYVPVGLIFISGLALLFAPLRPVDPSLRLFRGAAVACAGYLALYPTASGFRLELVFLPLVAVGAARAVARWGIAPKREGARRPQLERQLEPQSVPPL